jgi:hypothetical protein
VPTGHKKPYIDFLFLLKKQIFAAKFISMKYRVLYCVLLVTSLSYSQVVIQKTDSISHWEKKNSIGMDLSEIAFVNWNPGGVSSFSALLKSAFIRRYTKQNIKWGNELIMRYGQNKQDGIEWRKTDDVFQINSNFGYRRDSSSFWFHSARFSFSTQFSNGYSYPNTSRAISKPLAPAFTFLGAGAEYSNKPRRINLYFSPLTFKNTLVLDQRLANQGAFGVTRAEYDPITGEIIREGKNVRTEVGFLFTSHLKMDVYKNMALENRLNLYTDYLNNFGNIDVDWQFNLDMIVNQYVRANVGLHLVYDDDIKAKERIDGRQVTVGPKVQLKQMLGIGVNYEF